MRTTVYSLILVLNVASFTLFGQIGWDNHKHNSIQDIFFLNDQVGWTGGFGIHKTIDGGKSWVPANPPILYADGVYITKIRFSNLADGWAVGVDNKSGNCVYKTDNGGLTWQRKNPLGNSTYFWATDVFFLNSQMGWICGSSGGQNSKGTLSRTTDGGDTWQNYFLPLNSSIQSMCFINENVGWICGGYNGSLIQKTTDGGLTWTSQNSGTNYLLTSVFFLDALNGFSVGINNTIVFTSDGGLSWQTQNSGITDYFHEVKMFAGGIVFIIGSNKILYSNNNGTSWSIRKEVATTGWPGARIASFVLSTNTIWTVGDYSFPIRICKSTNGGIDWSDLTFHSIQLNDIFVSSSGKAWTCGDLSNTVMKSSNQGFWEYTQTGLTYDNATLNRIAFIDDQKGFAVLMPRSVTGNLLKTTDGGNSWSLKNLASNIPLQDICFVNNLVGYIVGGSGLIMKTLDGGTTWGSQVSGTTNYLFGVKFKDENNGWAVGRNGTLLHTVNGGLLWTKQSCEDSTYNFKSVDFYDFQNGWAVGEYGSYIFKTANAGNTWTKVLTGVNSSFNDCQLVGQNEGWIVGYKVLHSLDGGLIWKDKTPIDVLMGNFNMKSVFMKSFSEGWVVGDKGLYYTSNGGITFVQDKYNQGSNPLSQSLLQNYPNPFNPTTKIVYSIEKTAQVSINIFDLLGNKVAEPVNGEKQPGTHEVEFDASYLATGIYFYQLQTGNVRLVKKMVLIK